MDVYIYFDNSNIFIEVKRLAEERNGLGHRARQAVRLHFDNLLALASAGRTVKHAVAAGSVPPELQQHPSCRHRATSCSGHGSW